MKCEFCRTEIADDAKICPHCRKMTEPERTRRRGNFWTWAFVLVVGFIVFVVVVNIVSPEKPLAERIDQACESQFTYDLDAQTRCKLALTVRAVESDSESRLRTAAGAAGVR